MCLGAKRVGGRRARPAEDRRRAGSGLHCGCICNHAFLLSRSPQASQVQMSPSDVLYPRVAGVPLAQPLVEHYVPRSLDPNMPVIVNTCSLREEGEGTEDRHSVADGEMYRYSEDEDSEAEEKSDGELVVLTD